MSDKPRILVVDDEPNIRRILEVAFEKVGYAPETAESAEAALDRLRVAKFDVLLTDATMPGRSGYELLRDARGLAPEMPVILMTAYGTIPQAVSAIRDGAFEYVTKPFDLDALKRVVAGALRAGADPAAPKASKRPAAGAVIAESPAMRQVLQLAEQVADSKATVMLGGESGVGKEVIARLLHARSGRARGPFVAVSCAALPETLLESELFGYEKGAFTGAAGAKAGRFEAAGGGTLFLDEVGDIPPGIQVKLLRALQEREIERLGGTKPIPVNVRIVTATHRDLQAAVDAGAFRLDLLFRLKVVELSIPPLRERREDVAPLAEHFLAKFCAENGRAKLALGAAALARLERYAWPGNVRELENTVERAVVLAPAGAVELDEALLPAALRAA